MGSSRGAPASRRSRSPSRRGERPRDYERERHVPPPRGLVRERSPYAEREREVPPPRAQRDRSRSPRLPRGPRGAGAGRQDREESGSSRRLRVEEDARRNGNRDRDDGMADRNDADDKGAIDDPAPEQSEEDMMAAMGFGGFGTTKVSER